MPNAPAATTPPPGPQIKSRKPTGEIGYPLILLCGEEKAGKSLVPVVLSTSDRVGMTYWIDLGEGAADEYAALPGADYLVIEHNGTYREILEQITAIWHEANRVAAAGEPPVVLVIDSMSALWTMLVNWTNDRAKRSKLGQKILRDDPDAEVDPTMNLWNDANKRNSRVMNLLMTFPGIAIVTARGKEVAVLDAGGRPIPNRKERKPEGQKGLASDVDCWLWMSREPRAAELVGVRSLRVSAGDDLPTKKVGPGWDVLDLDAFVFDVLGATSAKKDDLPALRGDEFDGVADLVATCPSTEELHAIWEKFKDKVTPQQRTELSSLVTARLEVLRQHEAGEEPQAPGEASLQDHGPESDAEKLRQAAEARQQQDAAAEASQAPAEDGQEVLV